MPGARAEPKLITIGLADAVMDGCHSGAENHSFIVIVQGNNPAEEGVH